MEKSIINNIIETAHIAMIEENGRLIMIYLVKKFYEYRFPGVVNEPFAGLFFFEISDYFLERWAVAL